MENLLATPVGAFVSQDYRTAPVFSSFGIDFCCRGNDPLALACERQHVDAAAVCAALEALGPATVADPDANLAPGDLIAHIEAVHHTYIRENGPVLEAYLDKIATVHGSRHPELQEILMLFQDSFRTLELHLHKEEMILFPMIRRLAGVPTNEPACGPASVTGPVSVMRMEHEDEGDRFREMRRLSNNFTPPEDACTTYRVAFQMLEAFEADLHRHIHLENNVLFAHALALEGITA